MRRLGVQGLIFFQLGEPPILHDAIVDCRIPFFRAVCCVVTHCWHLLLSWTSSLELAVCVCVCVYVCVCMYVWWYGTSVTFERRHVAKSCTAFFEGFVC
ncbi:unnamed protein product, partial [Trichogramma brassicae]